MRQMAPAELTNWYPERLGALVARHIRFVFVTGYGDHGLPTYRDWPTLRKPGSVRQSARCKSALGQGSH